jgi:hypothetical protein
MMYTLDTELFQKLQKTLPEGSQESDHRPYCHSAITAKEWVRIWNEVGFLSSVRDSSDIDDRIFDDRVLASLPPDLREEMPKVMVFLQHFRYELNEIFYQWMNECGSD